MKTKLKILMAVSEVAPFTKTGGLGDVGGALPKALKDLDHDVRIITPQYRDVNERKYILRDVIRLQNISVQLGDESVEINVKSAFLPNSKVQVYFLDYRPFFFRKGLYVDEQKGKDFPDNDKRFILFSRGIIETLIKLQWQPDVIHCNDWQTGLIPFFVKTLYKDDPFFKKTSTLMTVHNFVFQGNYPESCLKTIGVEPGLKEVESIKVNDYYSFLRAGITYSDKVNTVSKTYVEETSSSPEFGFGLEPLLEKRQKDYSGIVNGIDELIWNPETDDMIWEKYTSKELGNKVQNKEQLFETNGIKASIDTPCLCMISRLTDQKGLDWIKEIFPKLMSENLVLFILGIGDAEYHKFLQQMQKKYPDKLSVHLKFDEVLAHRLIAGSDIFLMPSKFEPCGLTQLYSMKYGTIPVVNATGGLVDTVQTFDADTGKGNGFVMEKATASHLLKSIKKALSLHSNKKMWQKIMKSAMREDYSWESSAKKYLQLYAKCITHRKTQST